MSSTYHIQENRDGRWYNHQTKTWTLTTDQRYGAFLSTSIIIWMGFIATMSWSIIKYAIHQFNSKTAPRRALSDQISVVLRNSPGELSMAWLGLKLFWRWKSKWRTNLQPLVWLCVIMISVICLFGGWTLAKFFVTYIWVTTGDDCLLLKGFCGVILWTDPSSLAQLRLFRTYNINNTQLAEIRVRQCYGTNPDPLVCGVFPQTSITWHGYDAPCPLADDGLCISVNSTPYAMDTGRIHTSDTLGINVDDADSVEYRRLTTCSPVHNGPFVTFLDANETDQADYNPPGTRWQILHYGPVAPGNWTFQYSEYTPYFPFGFDVTPYSSAVGGDWIVNTSFFDRTDATVSIFFVTANHIGYEEPVYDPVFEATYPYLVPTTNRIYYAPSFYVNTIACVDQHQFCDPQIDTEAGCTGMLSVENILGDSDATGLFSANQLDTIQRLAYTLQFSDIAYASAGRGGASLLASRTTYGDISIPLPSDHWRSEVSNWFAIQLAKLQQEIIDYAAGPRNSEVANHVDPIPGDFLQAQCSAQRIRFGNAGLNKQNFRLVPIYGIAAVGFVLIILGLSIDTIVGKCQMRGGRRGFYRRQKWLMDDSLQLHRAAYEGTGLVFHGCGGGIPMRIGQVPPLAIEDDNHPRLGQFDSGAAPLLNQEQRQNEHGAVDDARQAEAGDFGADFDQEGDRLQLLPEHQHAQGSATNREGQSEAESTRTNLSDYHDNGAGRDEERETGYSHYHAI